MANIVADANANTNADVDADAHVNADTNTISIYRYKFSSDIMDIITEFSKIHQFDERKIYKESWGVWLEDNIDVIDDEINRLRRLGYEGDIVDKMFKAGRYYFRKKNSNSNLIENKKNKQQMRRSYIIMEHNVLDAMDAHINSSMKNKDFSPASGYINFCTSHISLLQNEIGRLCSETTINSTDLADKIKKTYKNRYFIITQQQPLKKVQA
jgi:hypothetical protein